jgi:hypothetical protein
MNRPTSNKPKLSKSRNPSISITNNEKTDLKQQHATEQSKVAFECPQCHWIMRVEKPNQSHPIPLVAKPSQNSLDGDFVIQSFVCRNPKCQESFAVYWSNPKDFLMRV